MQVLSIVHRTEYAYREPVRFGEHRLLFRPRDSHDMRLVDSRLKILPASSVRWMHDVFSNSVAVARFDDPAERLLFESVIVVEHYAARTPVFDIAEHAQYLPFAYALDDLQDLGRTTVRHHPDDGAIEAWARSFFTGDRTETLGLLSRMTQSVRADFAYRPREAEGVQAPSETLARRRGTCRDFALLMMEAVRSLGLAARFVTGYVFDPAVEAAGGVVNPIRGKQPIQGAGATHAWVQVYLPGAGWVEYDPTNGIIGGENLIRVGVARDPSQAIPLQGSYFGPPEAFVKMDVCVDVLRGNVLERSAA
ncbi:MULTISPECIES: transglutaminase family protein [Thalassobaculum]|uniref:Transglutaminase-like enzyme, putative cysteine protease n=1 Tax=Thalassobaculum litoreum DSM 18839 TaxID=1123362 RepID=A0A8G2BIS4_9PROT|nr:MULTISPECIES: transglutaminase family protein [Thalassobaculum]SDF94571.1 Transglutaminase-like enzyme, putative cysteine protease [Thalassobaculum litoreum DSM 18839]